MFSYGRPLDANASVKLGLQTHSCFEKTFIHAVSDRVALILVLGNIAFLIIALGLVFSYFPIFTFLLGQLYQHCRLF